MGNWDNYHRMTNNKPPRKNVVHFISKYNITGNAIDLGCGTGCDTIFLIKNNWNVLAIDSSNVEERIRSKLSDNEQGKLKFDVQKFEELSIPKCDLLISNNSLSFCDKDYFYEMWKEICLKIKNNGYFVGNFFGINDEWNTKNDRRTFFSKNEVIELFKDFEILEIQEIEKDKPTAEGKMKHWHIIEVIAIKNKKDRVMEKYEFFIAGRARNKENILKICDLFDKYNIKYYCFLKNEDDWGYGNKNQTAEEKQKEFESLDLKSEIVLKLFNSDLEGEKNSKNLLLVLPAGKAAHIESGIAYGLGKKCYAVGEYDATDTLYNIFEEIFANDNELEKFLKKYSKKI